jgi:hypothetical protein
MREVIEERPEHDQAGARPAAPARPRPGRAEVALLTVAVLTLAHQVGHVLRADSSGWPFTRDLTWFTASLFVYPALLAALILLRERPWARVTLAVALLGSLQAPHMFWETPADQYGTWAHGVSWMPAAPGRPNLLGTSSPALGVVSVAVALLLSVAVPVALMLVAGDLPRFRRPGRVAAAALLVLVLGVDLAYGWAWASTDRSRLARMIVWQESDVSDYRRFPARPVPTRPPVFWFRRSPAADRPPVAIVSIRQGGRLVERDLEGFLRSTGTTAFLAVKGDSLVSEAYFRGYRHDSTVSSFSVAKPVVSALAGIAIAQGRIATGRTVSAYLSERLWGPLGMEADGSWSLDSRRSGLELLQAGLNGRAIDFAKLGALYLHGEPGGDGSSSPAAGSPTRPKPTPGPIPRLDSSTTGGPDPAPRPVHLRVPEPQRGPGPVRHRIQRRPLAGAAGRAGPPPVTELTKGGRCAQRTRHPWIRRRPR